MPAMRAIGLPGRWSAVSPPVETWVQLERAGDSVGAVAALHRPLALILAGALATAACGNDDAAAGDEAEPVVVTTVSPITSIAASVIGDLAEIRGVVPEGTNSHTFEPSPSVSETLEEADVVFANGLQLEEPTLELARDVASDAEIVELGELTLPEDEYLYDFSFPEDEGKPNPHLWTDPTLAAAYAGHIASTMSGIDPENADRYRANVDAFDRELTRFDTALREALGTVPAGNRKLLTYHDAYAYWARTYGWEVVGAIQPSDFGEPTARDVAELVDQIRDEEVPAVFGSEVFPSPALEQIARETGAIYVDDLRDDDLPGDPGDAEHSYLGLMRYDYVTVVEALGGDPSALEDLVVRDVGPDTATYPQ
jgi:ABC-type Zn uptake system ZnuABC Zn-binding protein ZnuA